MNDRPDFELALLSDIGNERPNNEDACGKLVESAGAVVFVVADGVGGYNGGEVASQMGVEVTLRTWQESPPAWGPAKRLHRAVQNANIEIHNRALAVPELRRMATTLTAVAVVEGLLHVVHCGDCRLYLLRGGRMRQITKDHTMVGERVRLGLISPRDAHNHPERSVLSRSLGRDLIASLDRISMPLMAADRLLLCSDGLYGVLDNQELGELARQSSVEDACKALIEAANQRGTADNLTAAVFETRVASSMAATPGSGGLLGWLRRLLGRHE